ncbi:MAG: Flagellar basal body-associated protein FliL [Rhodocyclaceae bacterium]|nr:Flagellar basal body-associated protein FliL [Rhodocyclaceae bacterium]
MAKDAKAAAESAEQAVKPKKSKKLLIITLAAVLLLVLAGGGATLLLLKKGDDTADEEDAAETTQPKKKTKDGKEAHPVFVNLEPFTVNLVPETGDQYLQVTLSVEFDEPTGEQLVKVHMPKIRNNVTLLLSSKKPSEVLTMEGKEKLAGELKKTINDVLAPARKNKAGEVVNSENGPAKEVLFTSFIVQ